MSLFGDFYKKPINFKKSKKEEMVSHSEDWSAAILSGSSDLLSTEGRLSKFTYILLIAVAVFASSILIWRLFSLQVAQGRQNTLLANSNRIRTTNITAPRGAIYDRNGVLLARNIAQFDLVVLPMQLPKSEGDLNNISNSLSAILEKPKDELLNRLKEIKKSNQTEVVLESNIDREKSLQIEEKSRLLTGVFLESNPKREYLDEGMLAHFLGYIGRISAEEWKESPQYRQVDMIGKSGIEKSYENELKGTAGKEQIEVDATGKPIRFLARVEPIAGNNVYLSIDWELQKQMYNAIKSQVEKSGSKAGSGIALDPQTGEVLAAVNYPTYDSNLFAKGISQKDYDGLLNNDAKPLLNRVTSGNYPVGSVIKPMISAAALEEKVVTSSTTVNDTGKLEVQNIYDPSVVYTFKGWKLEGIGVVNAVRAIEQSSDIYYYQVGGGYKSFQGLGEKRLLDWYQKFGFGKKTGLDIAEESAGYLPSPEKKKKATGESWYVGDTYNVSIGQGDLKATPIQMAIANAAIANGGKVVKPHLLKSVQSEKSLVRAAPVDILKGDFISKENLRIVQQGMENVVSQGTACCSMKSEVPVQVAGKTGTAETSSEGLDGKNLRTKPHAWFTAYAPAQNPRISSVIMIENSGEGSQFAAPATKEVLKWYFNNR